MPILQKQGIKVQLCINSLGWSTSLCQLLYYGQQAEFKTQLIKTYSDIKYHDKASSYIGMTINRSVDLSKIYISQQGLTQRIFCDFLPDNFLAATSPASSHLFNHVPEDKPSKYLSIIMALCIWRDLPDRMSFLQLLILLRKPNTLKRAIIKQLFALSPV